MHDLLAEDASLEEAAVWMKDREAAYSDGVTVVIPSIPPRRTLLLRALDSVAAQTSPAASVSIAYDIAREGAGPTRTRALRAVQTRWTAFLDDDDEMMSHHLERLLALHAETDADVCVPWFEVVGGADPFPQHRGNLFDDPDKAPHDHRIFPITYLVRTVLVQACTFPKPAWGTADWAGDDYPVILRMHELGGRFAHTPDITWTWHHHGYGQPGRAGNTSGLPSRW